ACCELRRLTLTVSYTDMDVSRDIRPMVPAKGTEFHFERTSTVCTVTRAGDAACFGLADGSAGARLPGRFTSVSAQADGACGITTEGAIVCSTGTDVAPR